MRAPLAAVLLGLSACGGADAPSGPPSVAYACDRGVSVEAVFNPVSRIATVIGLVQGTDEAVLLPQRPSASGFLYATDRVSLSGKGAEATITVDGQSIRCRAIEGSAPSPGQAEAG